MNRYEVRVLQLVDRGSFGEDMYLRFFLNPSSIPIIADEHPGVDPNLMQGQHRSEKREDIPVEHKADRYGNLFRSE